MQKLSILIMTSILILSVAYLVFPQQQEQWVNSVAPTISSESIVRQDKDNFSDDYTGATRYHVTADHMDLDAVDSFPQKIEKLNANSRNYEVVVLVQSQLYSAVPLVPYNRYEYDKEIAQYLEPTEYIQTDTPLVTKTAVSFLSDEVSVQEIVSRALKWNEENIEYDTALAEAIWMESNLGRSAEETLEYGKGTCIEYAHTFIAFMRNLGIPARFILGYYENPTPMNHAWAEYYLKGYGWIPVETQSNIMGTPNFFIKLFIGKDYASLNTHVNTVNADYEKMPS